LKKNEENCEELEYEIVSLRKDLEKSTAQLNRSLKFEKGTKILDDIINCQRSPFIKIGLRYDVVFSLPTPSHATTKEVQFVTRGVQTGFLKEQPTIDCVEQIDELHAPHMPIIENVVTNDIVVDIPGCSTSSSEPNPESTSYDQTTQKYVPYHHPHHKN
jgi:hypothetical protein